MGAPITELDEFTASYPSIANGEAGNGTVFTAPHQVAANRTKFLKGLLDNGIRKIREVADAATLKALTGLANGQLAQLARTGIYTYASDTDGDGELAPRRYTVTAGGILRAVAFGIDSLNVANGVAGLDASAKVPSSQLRGHIVAAYVLPDLIGGDAGTGTFKEVTTSFVNIPNVAVGDMLVVEGNLQINLPASGNYLSIKYRLRDTADATISTTQGWAATAPTNLPSSLYAVGIFPVSGVYVVQNADVVAGTTLKVTLGHDASVGQTVVAANTLSRTKVMHVRNTVLWAFWTSSSRRKSPRAYPA